MSNELIPQDVRALYSSLVFHQNPAFSITELPGALLCFAPDSGYSSVKPAELQALSERLIKACNKTLDSALDNVSSLTSLGTLVQGLPSNTIASVSPAVALSAANDPAFVQNIIRGPEVLQQIFINKIITVNSDPNVVLQNIPDDMAGLIPLPLLTFSGNTFNLEQIEKKKWKKEQASLFFHKLASSTTNYTDLSPYILQGFSCSAVQSIPNNNTVNIVKACRGKKVPLVEDQLSCMAYHVAANASPQDFTSYPVDMLLYYPYSQIPSANCRSYFTEIGGANFYVFSETSNRPTALTNSAKNCLGITGTSLSSADLNVLNNMVCILNGSYIENSDNLILEKLKKCEQLTAGQIASVQKVLFSGTTKYGNSSTWTQKTLADLEELPLFLTSEFWSKFKQVVNH
ncbi:mesothelin-like protein [Polyodon spathula]|uniref:mesothelin-like protein n=1 Tax=Polyodon spathula TaxID=7913 RepID=UPI001B7DDAC6|nr:mesothelin-like protein [Polyodon spathula]